jgi:hypothetical protein
MKKTIATPHTLRISKANSAGMLLGFKGRGGSFHLVDRHDYGDEEISEGLALWQEKKGR